MRTCACLKSIDSRVAPSSVVAYPSAAGSQPKSSRKRYRLFHGCLFHTHDDHGGIRSPTLLVENSVQPRNSTLAALANIARGRVVGDRGGPGPILMRATLEEAGSPPLPRNGGVTGRDASTTDAPLTFF
eukprot:3419978-Pyramimonas_sp.AAC.1